MQQRRTGDKRRKEFELDATDLFHFLVDALPESCVAI